MHACMYGRAGTADDRYTDAGHIPAKKGGKWNRQEIEKILHNPIYAGYVKWDNIIRQGEHSAIIDKDLYESINGPINVTA